MTPFLIAKTFYYKKGGGYEKKTLDFRVSTIIFCFLIQFFDSDSFFQSSLSTKFNVSVTKWANSVTVIEFGSTLKVE